MSVGVELGTLLDAARVERLRRAGALVLDVDDTLLARERAGGIDRGGGEETFAESASAALLPQLLQRGFRVALITGHGWRQLETRLVAPVVERLRETGDAGASVERLRVYANRGATKIVWDGERHTFEEAYGNRHQLRAADVLHLRGLLESLGEEFEADVRARREWYEATFPRFDFSTLPARVNEREGAVLVLRPIPARRHARDGASSARAEVHEHGLSLLRRMNLDGEYELAESGRSSIEITRHGVSKETAMRDLVAEVSAATGAQPASVEEALMYVGDEFDEGGNDVVIPLAFPRSLCLSVAPWRSAHEALGGVVSLAHATKAEGTAATHALLSHLLNLSA